MAKKSVIYLKKELNKKLLNVSDKEIIFMILLLKKQANNSKTYWELVEEVNKQMDTLGMKTFEKETKDYRTKMEQIDKILNQFDRLIEWLNH